MLKKLSTLAVIVLVVQVLFIGMSAATVNGYDEKDVHVTLDILQEFRIQFYWDEDYVDRTENPTLSIETVPTGSKSDTIWFKVFANDDVHVTFESEGFDPDGSTINPLVEYTVTNKGDFAAGPDQNPLSFTILYAVDACVGYCPFPGSLMVTFDGSGLDDGEWPLLKAGNEYKDIVNVTLAAVQ